MASAFASAIPYVADALVILGVFVMTVGVYGAIRMPDTYTKLHAMSKAVFLGVVSLCASSAVTGDPAIIYRAILIGVFLLVTTPISSFVIARAAYPARGEDGGTGACDESGHGLTREKSHDPFTKVAGLSFQLSRKTTPGADDHRPHEHGPASLARCADFRPHPDCEFFTRQQLACRNLASIRFSRYRAVCSGPAQSAFTRTLIIPDYERALNAQNLCERS